MGNKILAVFLGAFVGMFVVGGLEQVTAHFYQWTVDVPDDKNAIAEAISKMPVGSFLCLLTGYLIGSFTGGLTASLIAKEKKQQMSLLVGAVILAGGIINFYMFPHPIWFVSCSLLVYLPAAFLGGKLGGLFKKKDSIQKI